MYKPAIGIGENMFAPILTADEAYSEPQTVESRVKQFLAGLKGCAIVYHSINFPGLPVTEYSCDFNPRSTYWRIVCDNGTQRMVECFVDKSTGDILKAEGWAKPAKHSRGTVMTSDGLREILNRKNQSFNGYLYL